MIIESQATDVKSIFITILHSHSQNWISLNRLSWPWLVDQNNYCFFQCFNNSLVGFFICFMSGVILQPHSVVCLQPDKDNQVFSRSVILHWSLFMVGVYPWNQRWQTFIDKQQNDADISAAMLQPSSELPSVVETLQELVLLYQPRPSKVV